MWWSTGGLPDISSMLSVVDKTDTVMMLHPFKQYNIGNYGWTLYPRGADTYFIMDQAVLLGLGSQADPQSQQKAMQYFEQLKASENGWKLCASTLTAQQHQQTDDYVKFFCFQVVEHYLKTRYVNATAEEQQSMKNMLLSWLQLQTVSTVQDKSYLRNKAAQIFSLAFITDYPHRWPSFFTDLLHTLSSGDRAIDMYLRILESIDSEVVDREITHTSQEAERNNAIKDAMRLQCVPRLVDSWYHIITNYESSNPELTCKCLDVIGAFVSWIDITLIANERFVSVLLKFMSNTLLRETACDCIHEIINKGMEPMAKLELIESFMNVLQSAGVFNVTEDEEGDYLAKLAKLVNGIGVQLILGWHKMYKARDAAKCKLLLQGLETKVPLMFKFLAHEDDDVSGAVAKFAHDYITLLKQIQPLSDTQKANVKNLLYVIVKKMKYDDSYGFDSEGEEEAMFQEYRKELKIIFNNLGALDGDLVLQTVHELFLQTVQHWQESEYQDVEVAITLVYMLAEALPTLQGQFFSGDQSKINLLQEMMRQMMTSRVSCYQHPAVSQQFFETVVRYDRFFNQELQYIPDILMAFLDERGLRNPSVQVCSRAAYLFSRFVKNINKHHLQNYLEDILKRVHDLLILQTPNNGLRQSLSSDDQLFLYETAGILIIQSLFPAEKKQELMKQLLAPIVSKFEELLQALVATTDENQQQAYAECLTKAMAFGSRTSKGFSMQQTMKQCGCVEVYTHTLQVFLHALTTPVQRQQLHGGVRQFLHRMVVCMEQEVLPFVPIAMENLLKNADAKELYDFIPLLNQVVSKFKKQIAPFLQEVFMPIVTTIFTVLSSPADEKDQVAANEKKLLQRGYFSFLSALVNNDVTQVLSNQESQNLEQVLMTVIQGAVDIPDPQGQKTCYAILKKLIELWGGKDGLTGFDDFVYKSIIPACFMGPMKPTFDLADAQTVLVLNECAACLKASSDKMGEGMLLYLQQDYLPSLNTSPQLTLEFCQALKSDIKIFRNYFKSFILRAKS